jgi:hypothetical protein
MPVLVLLLSLIILPLQAAEKTSHSAVWGKVVRAEQTVKGVNYKYFIYFEKEGKPEAYPIDTDKKEIKELIEKNLNMSVRVEGEVKEVELNLDAPKQKVLVFIPASIKPLTLSALSLSEPVNVLQKKPMPVRKTPAAYDGGGIRLNDKVTNALIYTGAALMIGNALKGTFSK